MNSGLDILQALSVVTANAFDSCFSNMIDIIKRSGGSISTKTAAEIASNVTTGVFQPITAQVDPLRMGEAHRSMRIARDIWGAPKNRPCLKPGALERLVQDYPSHGFVIDKEEAEKYFSKVDDLSPEELKIANTFADDVRWPKEEPEVLDIYGLVLKVREIQRQHAEKSKPVTPAATSSTDPATNNPGEIVQILGHQDAGEHQTEKIAETENAGSDQGENLTQHVDAKVDDGGDGPLPAEAEPAGQTTNSVPPKVNGSGKSDSTPTESV